MGQLLSRQVRVVKTLSAAVVDRRVEIIMHFRAGESMASIARKIKRSVRYVEQVIREGVFRR